MKKNTINLFQLILIICGLISCNKNNESGKTNPLVPVSLSTIITDDISDIDVNSFECGGSITNDGNGIISSKGLCWSIHPTPTINDSISVSKINSNDFKCTIVNLIPYNTYYIRAFATNSAGTSYGAEKIITVGILTDIDNNTYKMIRIGNKTWMASNLITTHYNDGQSIPNVIDNNTWTNLSSGAYCYYNNSSSNYDKLYNWYAVNTNKLAPKGWHIPTLDEINDLMDTLGGDIIAGGKLKSTSTQWNSPNAGATNSTGFTALPAGTRSYNGVTFCFLHENAWFWTTTKYDANTAFAYVLTYLNPQLFAGGGGIDLRSGFTVRCVKD